MKTQKKVLALMELQLEFYKLFWNNIKEFYENSINYSFQT